MNTAFAMSCLRRYKALQLARAAYRSAGIRPLPKMSQQRIDAEAYVSRPDVVEWATQAVRQIKTFTIVLIGCTYPSPLKIG
jgi:hypothetical protein